MATPIAYGATLIDAPEPGDVELISVTSIINAISGGDGLTWWAARQSAEWAIDHEPAWRPLAQVDRGKAVTLIAQAHNDASEQAQHRGTVLHDLSEQWIINGRRPPTPSYDDAGFDAAPYLDQFGDWLDLAQPEFEAAELTVYNPDYGYAGTLDSIATIDGVRFLIDWKTKADGYARNGKPVRPYPEKVALQLVAYRRATLAAVFRARRIERPFSPRLYVLSPDEQARAVPMPEVDAGLAVMLTPDHCKGYPVRIDDPVFDAFLYAIEAYRWVRHTSRAVMGAPLDLQRTA